MTKNVLIKDVNFLRGNEGFQLKVFGDRPLENKYESLCLVGDTMI